MYAKIFFQLFAQHEIWSVMSILSHAIDALQN